MPCQSKNVAKFAVSRRVFSDKMTSLEISDMQFVKFEVFCQYLNNIWSMFVQQVSVQVYMSPKYEHHWLYRSPNGQISKDDASEAKTTTQHFLTINASLQKPKHSACF